MDDFFALWFDYFGSEDIPSILTVSADYIQRIATNLEKRRKTGRGFDSKQIK